MISSVPLETTGPTGGHVPVDLTLDSTASGYAPADAIVPVTIGKKLSDGVNFTKSGFGFQFQASGSDAPIATASGVFFANAGGAAASADFAVNPVPEGVDSFVQIRAATSPERYVLHFTLPAGARLAPAQSAHPIPGDPPTAIAIMRGSSSLGYVYQPDAFDVDGTQVPATATIEGSNVVLTISHHGMALHYPVLVDPVIATLDFFTGSGQGASDWAGWQWTQHDTWTPANPANCAPTCLYTFGEAIDDPTYWPGLYTSMPINNYYAPGDYAFFYYPAPAGTYLGGAAFAGSHNAITTPFAPLGVSNYIVGIGNANGWASGVSNYNGVSWQAGNPAAYSWGIGANTLLAICYPNCDGGTAGSTAYMGIQAAGPGTYIATSNHRDTVTASNSTVYLGDVNPPAISGSPVSIPSWTNDGGQTYTTTALFSDIGLGVNSVTLTGAAGGTQTFPSTTACGDYYRNPCPGSRAWFSWPFSYTLPQGVSSLSLSATDPTGKIYSTPPTTARIDRTPPAFGGPSGSLWDARNQSTDHRAEGIYDSADYSVTLPATDQYAGLARIDVQVLASNGAVVVNSPDPTPTNCAVSPGGCPETRIFAWQPATSVADGTYTIQATATDTAGNHAPISWTVTLSRQGDIYHATVTEGGSTQVSSDEWSRSGTNIARYEDDDHISTRSSAPCGQATCDEVRVVGRAVPEDAPYGGSFEDYLASMPTDPRLPVVDHISQYQTGPLPAPQSQGSELSALQVWQRPPPAHGTTYSLYSFDDTAGSGDTPPATTTVWLDAQTRYPLKTQVVDDATGTSFVTYYSYDTARLTTPQVAPDFFSVAKPSQPVYEADYDYENNGPSGMMTDRATSTPFQPWDLGSALQVVAGSLCLDTATTASVTNHLPTTDPDPTNTTGGAVNDLTTLTRALSYYSLGATGCTLSLAGLIDIQTPTLEVMSIASNSPESLEYHAAFMADGTPTALTPVAGGLGAIFNVDPLHAKVAYAIPARDGLNATAMIDVGTTTVVITGQIDLSTINQIANLLVPR